MLSDIYMDFRIARRKRQKKEQLRKFCLKNEFSTLESFPVDKYKTSDTVFILGSGASITELSTDQWAVIKKHDSIGFNMWPLHDFIPTYYFFEATSTKNETQIRVNNILYNNLNARLNDYTKTAVIFHYLEKYFYDIPVLEKIKAQQNLFFCAPINLPAGDLPELEHALRRSVAKGYFNEVDKSVYRRGSVAKIMHFAIAAGYKNIVLLGVDLNTAPHFFDVPGFQVHPACEKMWYTKEISPNKVHETVDPLIHPVTMLDVIECLNQQVIKPKGLRLFNGARSSSLTDYLPYYWS